MEELKRRKANIQNIRQEQEQVTRRVQAAVSVLDGLSAELRQWDDNVVYSYWLFGHYHDNRAIDSKHILLWEQIVQII